MSALRNCCTPWASAPSPSRIPASLNGQRAFTLLVRAYDEVHAQLAFLRRKQGDVDELVPSLYTARNARRKRPDADDEDTAPEPEPGTGGQSTPLRATRTALSPAPER